MVPRAGSFVVHVNVADADVVAATIPLARGADTSPVTMPPIEALNAAVSGRCGATATDDALLTLVALHRGARERTEVARNEAFRIDTGIRSEELLQGRDVPSCRPEVEVGRNHGKCGCAARPQEDCGEEYRNCE